MALKVANANGVTSTGTAWVGGVAPTTGDTLSIGAFTITIDSPLILGTYPANGGAAAVTMTDVAGVLNINADTTFRGCVDPLGDATLRNQIVQAAGVTVTWDSSGAASPSATKYGTRGLGSGQQWCWKINGTSVSPATVQSNAGGGNAWMDNGGNANCGNIDWTYVNVIRFGDATNAALSVWFEYYASIFKMDHVSFDAASGQCAFQNSAPLSSPAQILTWDYCRFLQTAYTYSVSIGGAATGTAAVRNCYFAKNVYMSTATGWTIDDNTFADSITWNGFGIATSFKRNIGCFNSTGGQSIPQLGPSSGYGNYYMHNEPGGANPHWTGQNPNGVVDFDGDVFETNSSTTDGDCIACGGSNPNLLVKNCIVLPNRAGTTPGSLISAYSTPGTSCAITALHNTFPSDYTQEGRGVGWGETNLGYTGEFAAVKSNLGWSVTANRASIFTRLTGSTVQDVVTGGVASVDYNGKWNPYTGGTDGVGYTSQSGGAMFSSGTPGAHDVTVAGDPFFDKTRNIDTWSASRGGANSTSGALALLSGRVGHNAGSGDAGATPGALLAWVRDGFRVTAVALQNAGHDGVTIGAMPFQAVTNPALIVARRNQVFVNEQVIQY